MATYIAVIFISAQPLSVNALTADKKPDQIMSLSGDDQTPFLNKRKMVLAADQEEVDSGAEDSASEMEAAAVMLLKDNNPKAIFSLSAYVSKKIASFMAWINTDIEADLH